MPSAPIKLGSASSNRIAMTPATQQRSATGAGRFGSMSNLSAQKDE